MSELKEDQILSFMHELMDSADAIALRYFQKAYKSETKADKTPVTEADQKIEKAIRNLIQKCFPNHGIQGEEFGRENTNAEYVWVIDPIDGTKAFMAGRSTFTTLIGLLKNNKPYAGMVSQAVEKKRWCAVANTSLRARSARQSMSPQAPNAALDGLLRSARNDDPLKIATTSTDYFSAKQEQGLKQLEQQGAHITYGGDAYPYMMLAEGKANLDAVFDVGFQPHDILPLLPILQNAGLHIQFFDEQGLQATPTSNVVVAKSQNYIDSLLKYLAF